MHHKSSDANKNHFFLVRWYRGELLFWLLLCRSRIYLHFSLYLISLERPSNLDCYSHVHFIYLLAGVLHQTNCQYCPTHIGMLQRCRPWC